MSNPYRFLGHRFVLWLRRSFNLLWLVIVAGYFMVLTGQAVYHNYQSQEETKHLRERLTSSDLERTRLEALLEYYKTPAFQEKEIRRTLLLKKPNEKVYALPESNNAKDIDGEAVVSDIKPAATPSTQSIPRQWVSYLLHQGED